jgi:hypothetical protein
MCGRLGAKGVKNHGVACAELAQWGRPWCSNRTLLGCGERKAAPHKKLSLSLRVFLQGGGVFGGGGGCFELQALGSKGAGETLARGQGFVFVLTELVVKHHCVLSTTRPPPGPYSFFRPRRGGVWLKWVAFLINFCCTGPSSLIGPLPSCLELGAWSSESWSGQRIADDVG